MILCFYLEEISLLCQLCLPSFNTSVGFQGFPSALINLPYTQPVLGLMSFLIFNSLLDFAWVASLLDTWVFPFYHLFLPTPTPHRVAMNETLALHFYFETVWWLVARMCKHDFFYYLLISLQMLNFYHINQWWCWCWSLFFFL